MTITTEEFSASFHSLVGTTIGERRKNLFLLLNQIQNHEDIDFSAIQPQTPLEESFKVDALIRFRKIPDLIEVLKSENPVLIEKVLRVSSWFLEQALENTGLEEFVKNVFPHMSFNGKVKILNKLSTCLKNPAEADAIFNVIRDKYGLYLAWKLLPCCSGELILECIKLSKLEFTPRQLGLILKKRPQLMESILETLSENQGKHMITCKYPNIFSDILKKDMELFLKLFKDYKPSLRVGRRATSRLVLENRQNVIKNSEHIFNFLHRKLIINRISSDFGEFYFHMLPKSLQRFKNNYSFYLELLPSKICRLDVLSETFRKKYGQELWNDPDCVTLGLLKLMPVDERESWMLTHPKPVNLSEDAWVCLMKTEKSLPDLKKRIGQASDTKERAELVGCLVETCGINDDKAALIDVCKYFLMQHRNDDSSVLTCFLNTLKRYFCFNNLEEVHWKYINEIMQVFIAKKMFPYYCHEWFFAYINYYLEKNLPIKEELKKMSKNIGLSNLWNNREIKLQYQKQLLLTCAEIIFETCKGSEKESQSLQVLQAIIRWNKKHPKDQINLSSHKAVTSTLLEIVKKKDDSTTSHVVKQIISYCIPTKINKFEKLEILSLCFRGKDISLEMCLMEYLIKYEPLFVLEHIDYTTNSVLGKWYMPNLPFFWRFCRNYTHLDIPQKIIAICLGTVINPEEDEFKKKNSIIALSCLMQTREFLDFIDPYYPSDLIMDVNDEENQEMYKIQQAVAASLKNVIPPSCVLESVLNFSKGDYLHFIHRSLHSVSHSVAEEKLPGFFTSFTDRPVSVRKNAVYFTFKVLGKKEIEKIMKKFVKEKNSSIRKFLFRGTFGYFVKNPSDLSWDMVKQNVKSIDVNDQEAFDVLLQVAKVPSAYLAQYLVFAWEFLEGLPNPDNKLDEGKCKLLDAVSAFVVPSLDKDFCLGIIQKYLFTSKELTNLQRNIYSFTCKFVVYSIPELEREERVKIAFEFLKKFMDRTWHKSGFKKSGRNLVFDFLKEFCSYFIEKKCLAKEVLVKFVELWNEAVKPYEAFGECVYLQFTLIYLDFVKDRLPLAQVGEKLAKLCDSLLGFYGNVVASIFCESLNSYINNFLADDDNTLEENRLFLIESIISASSSSNCLIMAVSLLPLHIPTTSHIKVVYNRIVDMLEKNSDGAVQLTLSCYFNDIAGQNILVVPKKISAKASRRCRGRRRGLMWYVKQYSSKYAK